MCAQKKGSHGSPGAPEGGKLWSTHPRRHGRRRGRRRGRGGGEGGGVWSAPPPPVPVARYWDGFLPTGSPVTLPAAVVTPPQRRWVIVLSTGEHVPSTAARYWHWHRVFRRRGVHQGGGTHPNR